MEQGTDFYITSGTIAAAARCYVERRADDELAQALESGEFCYVLSSRQIGKSSLMVRTVERLAVTGITCVVIDLTLIGVNLTMEQWYQGLAQQLGRRLDIRGPVSDYWEKQSELSALQRWMGILQDVALPNCASRIVIFIDEVDLVRRLPFSTDEFFAAIRAIWNARAQDAEMRRLTFCIVGTADPADLIQDVKLTPFNIGKRIHLQDFVPAEAAGLEGGLAVDRNSARTLMSRILYWTDGHPCLTQRLCLAVSDQITGRTRPDVDSCCRRLFLEPNSIRYEDNLSAVRDRLLAEAERTELVTLYRQILHGNLVRSDEKSALNERLKLTGAVKEKGARLVVRNRIYAHVFSEKWATNALPGAEIRRQRAAYRLGLIRASAAFAGIIGIIVSLAIAAVIQAKRADRFATAARSEARRADKLAESAQSQASRADKFADAARTEGARSRELLYESDMALMGNAYERNDFETMRSLLDETADYKARGFEWRFWRRLVHQEQKTIGDGRGNAAAAMFSPLDGSIFTLYDDGCIRKWAPTSGRRIYEIRNPWKACLIGVFPDNRQIITVGLDMKQAQLWDVSTSTPKSIPCSFIQPVFLPMPRRLSASSAVVNQIFGRVVFTGNGRWCYVRRVGFGSNIAGESADMIRMLLGITATHKLVLFDPKTSEVICRIADHMDDIKVVAFSPDSRLAATASKDGAATIWDARDGRRLHALAGHSKPINQICFSPDSKILVTVSADRTGIIWDVATGVRIRTLRGHSNAIDDVSFSLDGKSILTASRDGTAKLWATKANDATIQTANKTLSSIKYLSRNDRLICFDDDGHMMVYDDLSGRLLSTFEPAYYKVEDYCLCDDGTHIATGSRSGLCRLYELNGMKCLSTFQTAIRDLSCVSVSRNLQTLIACSRLGTAEIICLTTRSTTCRIRGPRDKIYSAAFSPSGDSVATACADGTTGIWSTRNGKILHMLAGHGEKVYNVCFSPDGNFVATASKDQTARIWSVTSGKCIHVLSGNNAPIYELAYSPDGQRIVTAGGPYVRLWDAQSGRLLLTFPDVSGEVTSVAYSSDGCKIASTTKSGEIYRWYAPH